MERPNILILYTDQQRWDALGANGNADIRTPNLDRLAERSANFDRCFVQNPVCMPSRASFLTGRYPSTLGIMEMGVPMPEGVPNFATYFGRAGYHCANLGKLHFLPHANRDHTRTHPSYGFHQMEISDEPGVYEDAYRAWVRREAPDQLEHLSCGLPPARKVWLDTMGWDDPVKHPESGSDEGGRFDFAGPIAFGGDEGFTHSAFVGKRTQAYLRSRSGQGQPFACIAGFYSPHAPWVSPQRFLDQYDPDTLGLPEMPEEMPEGQERFSDEHLRAARHGYYAMVSEVDHWVGEILDTLEETGMAEETVVVFTSDHGEWLGEHGRWGKGYPAHDACSRVPLLISAPGGEGRRVSELVEAVDVLPTLLELAGLPVDSRLEGKSLAGAVRGEDFEGRTSALTMHRGWRCLRTERYRYVAEADGREALFDLEEPMGPYRNLVGDRAAAGALEGHRREMVRRLISGGFERDRVWPY